MVLRRAADVICSIWRKFQMASAIDVSGRPPKDRSLLASIACELTFDKTIIDAVDSARKFYAGEFNSCTGSEGLSMMLSLSSRLRRFSHRITGKEYTGHST